LLAQLRRLHPEPELGIYGRQAPQLVLAPLLLLAPQLELAQILELTPLVQTPLEVMALRWMAPQLQIQLMYAMTLPRLRATHLDWALVANALEDPQGHNGSHSANLLCKDCERISECDICHLPREMHCLY
jgi:hypothetical protein